MRESATYISHQRRRRYEHLLWIRKQRFGRDDQAQATVKAVATCWVALCLALCVACFSPMRFEVLPNSPQYLLRSPDSRRTPFPEVLKAYNGFEAGHAWIDLQSLMELRIENAYYEPGAPRSGLAGFLGTEIARYAVKNRGLTLLSVQPMENRPKQDVPVQDLIARAAMNFSHYRLYYEIVFARSNHSHGSVLLAADSQAQIDGLSAKLSNPEAVCSQGSVHCTVFPEACSVSVEMKVVLNGKPASVSWGSTLESVVEQPHHLEMKRIFAGELRPVRIDVYDPKSLLLPLLPGDRISWK